jgi:hypothetical protein
MVQGGARFGTNFLIGNNVRTTVILTGLAYDDVVVTGNILHSEADIIHQEAFASGNNILSNADRGQVRGRGVLAFNFDFGQGIIFCPRRGARWKGSLRRRRQGGRPLPVVRGTVASHANSVWARFARRTYSAVTMSVQV